MENVRAVVGQPVDDHPLILRRHAESASERTESALEALGYYDASIRVTTRRDGDEFVIRIAIEPGDPTRLADVTILAEGEAGTDPAFADLIARLPLRSGDVLHHGRYEEAKRAIETLAMSRGYFDGGFADPRVVIRRAERRADIHLRYSSGRRYRMGAVRMPPTPLSPRLLLRLVPFEEGEPYSADLIAELHRTLLASEYFQDVRIATQVEEAGADGHVPIDADLQISPRNRISLSAGASTDVGPRVGVKWERPWMNRLGHAASIESKLSFVLQDLAAQYSIPLNPPISHQLQLLGGWQREDIEDTERETYSAGIQRRRDFDNGWRQNIFVRWEQERYTQADEEGTSTLTLPGMSFGRIRRSGGESLIRGDRLFALVEGAHPDAFSDIALARGLVQAKRLDSWGPHRLSGRIEYGALGTEDFDRTPPSLRFFAGGDQSVRGFAYRSLGPRNENGELVGGRYLLTGSLEYGYQVASRWRAAVFFDAGSASSDSRFSEGFERGVGAGIRWLSPLAPINLDFAWGISEPDPPFRIHFSMGTEI